MHDGRACAITLARWPANPA